MLTLINEKYKRYITPRIHSIFSQLRARITLLRLNTIPEIE